MNFLKYHLNGLYKFAVKIVAIPKVFDNYSNLTSNVAINKLLSPVYFMVIFGYLRAYKGIPLFSPNSHFIGALPHAIYSSLFYVWCSYQFSPDLDVRTNRPGMNTFPFGATFLNSKVGIIFSPLQVVLGKLWYLFWQPYAELCTHRGVSHWPIISVLYRITYLYLWVMLVQFGLRFFGIYSVPFINSLKYLLNSFYPWSDSFGNVTWFICCFPVFVSDLAHEAVDALDSKRKGISFCPPQIPRGYFSKGYGLIKALIEKKRH